MLCYAMVHTILVLFGMNSYHLTHNGTGEIHFRSLVLVYYSTYRQPIWIAQTGSQAALELVYVNQNG